jgi:hypothetical protein
MSDTAKIPRPKFPRSGNGPGGRTEHDSRGNAFWMRSRASDPQDLPDTSTLSILGDAHTAHAEGISQEDPRTRSTKVKKPRSNES